MIFVKSILIGLVAALTLPAIWILLVVVIPLLVQIYAVTHDVGQTMETSRLNVVGYFSDWPVRGLAVLGFAGGFYWEFRRASRIRTH
jgi:type II secretory pathway component PulF